MSYGVQDGKCGNCESPILEKYGIDEPTGGHHCPDCGAKLI